MKFEKEVVKKGLERVLLSKYGKNLSEGLNFEIYDALSQTIMEEIGQSWKATKDIYNNGREAFYFSAEYLMGRAFSNNLINLGVYDGVKELLEELNIDINKIESVESDAGLGNGGLGRLAACFIESMATLNLPGTGYGIRYRFGMFRQQFEDGFQVEYPDNWLKYGESWSVRKDSEKVEVRFNKNESVMAVPYDTPIIGYGTDNINTLRLWQAEAVEELDLAEFNKQNYTVAMEEKNEAENISRVLYPNDDTDEGKKLRLKQQYFFTSASLQDIIRKFKLKHGTDFSMLPDFTSIQLNDTHPVVAIPELMRILVDVEGLLWDDAWKIVEKTFAYTNHTILSEALEKWYTELFKEVLPRIYNIIVRIHIDFQELLEKKYPVDLGRRKSMAIIDEDTNLIHMAWLAIHGSYAVNGVAALHTEILKNAELKDWYELYPERFQNKTNGVTQRRWLLKSNPELAELITELIGDKWITDLSELKKLETYVTDENILNRFLDIKNIKKEQLAGFIKGNTGVEVDPNSIFDIQVKRLHEYKRQILNIFHIMDLYNRIKENPSMKVTPKTYIFGAKAASGYFRAKGIIKLINEVAKTVNNDADVDGRLKVVFVENYNISPAEFIFPAADVSEQISTAGKEASGTGNMKFMMNGAPTLGTLDGANVEIVEEAGLENNFIFGMKVEDIIELKKVGYNPTKVMNETEGLKKVMGQLLDGTYSDGETGMFKELYNALLVGASWHAADHYFVLQDFADYRKVRESIDAAFEDRLGWAKKAWMNISNAGKFTSDRTIAQYAKEIWRIEGKRI
ncbi:MAG: glycogen/starch/alpha-glucan phosphorylase [Psychrilyobacter sp.]|uniref:glycogen/starch/alpha-glucan phosphorylase n=1 Tax=Psychrilyobacter sp. TaxID=2586924 RepID=UPI003C7862F6